MRTVWDWIINHWKFSIVAAIGGALAFTLNLPKLFTETRLARLRLHQAETEEETRIAVQFICLYAASITQKVGRYHLAFSEESLRRTLKGRAGLLHAALDLLVKEGRARKATVPGEWYID